MLQSCFLPVDWTHGFRTGQGSPAQLQTMDQNTVVPRVSHAGSEVASCWHAQLLLKHFVCLCRGQAGPGAGNNIYKMALIAYSRQIDLKEYTVAAYKESIEWLRDYITAIKQGKLHPFTKLERKAREATRNEPWCAHCWACIPAGSFAMHAAHCSSIMSNPV